MRRVVVLALAVALGAAAVVSAAPASAQTTAVTLSITSGPPGTTMTVRLSGFGVSEAVDISFDLQPVALAITDGSGADKVTITVPASAAPGDHAVNAVGRHSGLAARAVFSVHASWAQSGNGTALTSDQPTENVLTTSTVADLATAWRTPTTSAPASAPVVVGGSVIAGFADGYVRAFVQTTGAPRWSTKIATSPVTSTPAVVGHSLYVGGADGRVHALDARTGNQLWTYTMGSPATSAVTATGDTEYVSDANQETFALTTSGSLRWVISDCSGDPAVVGSAVFLGCGDGVTKVRAADGSVVWATEVSVESDVDHIAVFGGRIVATGAYLLAVVDADTGDVLAGLNAENEIGFAAPAVAKGLIYTQSVNSFSARRATDGEMQWSVSTSSAPGTTPVVAGDLVFAATTDTTTTAFDRLTGDPLWSTSSIGAVAAGAVVDGTFYVTDTRHAGVVAYTLPSP